MTKTAQPKIGAFHDGPMVGLFVGRDPGPGANVAGFIREDIARELVEALEECIKDEFDTIDKYDAWEAKARAAIQRAKEAGL